MRGGRGFAASNIAGVLTFSPYYHWRWEHAIHHGTAGDLDKRGRGDVGTMTVQEYLAASRGRRLAYGLVRNPLILFRDEQGGKLVGYAAYMRQLHKEQLQR